MSALPQSATPPGAQVAPARFAVVVNTGVDGGDERAQRVSDAFAAAGGHCVLFDAAGASLPQAIARAIADARQNGGAVVAAGGDGTVSSTAAAVLPTALPFGVLPLGTFNYFARGHGIPVDLEAAVAVLLQARPRAVTVGLVNERPFLVNASIGLYPQLIEDREAFKARFGRSRPVALASAVRSVLREHRQSEVVVELHEVRRVLRTTTLFVCASQLQLDKLGLPESEAVARGELVAVIVRPSGTWAMLGLLARGALGQLDEALAVESFSFERLTVQPWSARARSGRRVKLAVDGEVVTLPPPLRFAVAAERLHVLAPDPAAAA